MSGFEIPHSIMRSDFRGTPHFIAAWCHCFKCLIFCLGHAVLTTFSFGWRRAGMNNAKFALVIAEPLKMKSGHADMEKWKNFLSNFSNYF
jgi:hypothetical protein